MAKDATPHVVYIFNRGFERCSMASLYSLLATRSGATQVTLFAFEPTAFLEDAVQRLLNAFPEARIEIRTSDLMARVAHPRAGQLGRLLLPQELTGRILYLDGDTLVRHDIGALCNIDLGDKLVAAAPDMPMRRAGLVLERAPFYFLRKRYYRERLSVLPPDFAAAPYDYVNTGVFLFDLDRIELAGLAGPMADWRAATQFHFLDQDHLNIVFRNRIRFIDPAWNAIRGIELTERWPFNADERAATEAARHDPAIVHFAGADKPWLEVAGTMSETDLRWRAEWHRIAAEAPFTVDAV